MRQPSNTNDKVAITKHSRHQYSGSAVLEIKPNDFEKVAKRLAITFPTDAIITGGQFIVEEAFDAGSVSLGDKKTADGYLSSKDLTAASVTPLKVTGSVMDTLCDLMITANAVFSSDKGKATIIVNYIGLNKSDWTMGNIDE